MYKLKVLINNLTRSVSSLIKNLIQLRKENKLATANQIAQAGNLSTVQSGTANTPVVTTSDHQTATKIAAGKKSVFSIRTIKKVLIIVVIISTFIIIAFVLMKFLGNRNGNGATTNLVTPSIEITQSPPKEQSIYAKDPEILAIEEKIKVLDAELSSARITDTKINPPVVDLNVAF